VIFLCPHAALRSQGCPCPARALHRLQTTQKTNKAMAELENRYPQNVPGRYYVDDSCIDCDLCRATAPANFGRHEDGHSYVFKQPDTDEERRVCAEAKELCPTETIGDDG